ncbi:LysR substrate-binding domain-containing protein [Alcaligenes phenolicus]|jgi:DNA-binding transcriptional LysR family regulator|uniref:LysR family transcriptional regulator n=2 Tax=Alcaligenes TaxID=507 RepID=A0AAE9HAE7_ALCFA|nr:MULTISPECIES: LysR family transcriptional regulator [Alcaligenes]KGP01981.1 LysR family transcriptional regulator [Alcaligenes faecalis]KVX06936.1 LysR family transcriptional regulator [Alcaligenes faecalis]QCP81927.1 LysR family transcriptional regulator [Alcaligenes faecalis]QRF92014.1 LysR family transcriptional regulator [Alcaligenes faecalis]UPL21001.1 LysR family transcriptional regulator [Alcaligenes faecalis]
MKTTLDEMQAFIAVVDAGAISRAAEHLGLTVSAVSRTLNRLEEKLNTTLLRRTTRRLELTEEGAVFLERARSIVAHVEEAEEDLAIRRQQPVGRLRVDAASPFILHCVVPIVRGYKERYPQVSLELTSNEGWIDLLEHRTDVAIRIGRLKDSTLHARPIGNTRLRVMASPAYLEKHGHPRDVADLDNHVLLGFTQPLSLNEWPLPAQDGMPVHIKPSIAASSGETLRQLALDGVGIVSLSDFMTHRDREAGRLVQLFPKRTLEMCQPINAVYYRNTALSARISTFVSYLSECWEAGLGGSK